MDGKIGMFVNSTVGYQGAIVRDVLEAAAREGLAVDVFDAEHNAVQQAQDVLHFEFGNPGLKLCAFVIPEADAIQEGAVTADPTFHLAERMLGKNVGWITLNHGREAAVTALRTRFPDLPVALVAIDNVHFGEVQGQQLRRLLPGGGTVLCVRGNPHDSACVDRTAGLRHELEGSSITVSEIDCRWSDDVASKAVRRWLASPIRRKAPLDAVVCQNDHMARATRATLLALAGELTRDELRTIPVLGGDGLPEIGRPWVDDGTLTATVSVRLPGAAAVEMLARHWREGMPIEPVTRLPVESYPRVASLEPRSALVNR
jgi:hypothetical protein